MRRVCTWFFGVLLFLAGCAVQPPTRVPQEVEPVIRVGLVWGKRSVEFSMEASFQITSHDGTFIARGMRGHRWQAGVKSSIPGKTVYVLVAASMSSMETAQSMVREIEQKGFDVFIWPVGKQLRIGGNVVSDSRTYRVCLKKLFEDETAAARYRDAVWHRVETFVARRKVREAEGVICLKNLENGQVFESTKPILVRGAAVTLYDVPVGVGYHWERQETRTYPETVSFRLDNDGNLAAVNIVSLETYLLGVVPSEMPEGFPLEALKAQAVAARTEVLAKWGVSHPADPFDVCASVHCQVYSGLTKQAPSTARAVRETRGLVLWKDGSVCNAVYSAVCGGHGEDVERVWSGNPKSYLEGSYDGPGSLQRYGSLSDERNLKRWIDDDPPAYCNTRRGRVPTTLEYTKKYFRWEVRYTQEELQRIVREKTGQDVGAILDLVPLERGVSGRIVRLKIVGRRGSFYVDRELEIRKMLSSNTLWSSCFYVVKRGWRSEIPGEFVLKGAGWGHGVGMCQTGAAMMALRGVRFDRILKHYYQGIEIRRLF